MAVALTFADSHLRCPGNSLPNSANPFSINVWINAIWNGGSRLSFVGLYNGSAITFPTDQAGLQIGTGSGNGNVSCWYYGGGLLIESASGVMTPFNNTWVMITYVWDGTNHRLYLNGQPIATPTTTTFLTRQLTQVWINGFPPASAGTAECSAFLVDSYGAYNRGLSANEVLTLYSNAGSRGGILSGLVCQYEFDEGIEGSSAGSETGISPSVRDTTGRNQNLTNVGTVNTHTYTYPNTYANANIRPVQ